MTLTERGRARERCVSVRRRKEEKTKYRQHRRQEQQSQMRPMKKHREKHRTKQEKRNYIIQIARIFLLITLNHVSSFLICDEQRKK